MEDQESGDMAASDTLPGKGRVFHGQPFYPRVGLAVIVLGLALLALYRWGPQESLTNILFGARLSLNPAQIAQLAFVKGRILWMGVTGVGMGFLVSLFGGRIAALFAEGLRSGAPLASYARLFWASFLSLFFEIVFIRWISTEIRIFAFFKNVPLIAAFLGLGIGCLVAGRPRRLELLFVPGLALFIGLVGFGSDTFLRVISYAGATLGSSDQLIWGHTFSASWKVLAAVVFYGGVTVLFVMQVALFIPLGHLVGRGFFGLPRLAAYSTNILGALAGLLAYNLLACSYTGPCLWFLAGALPALWIIRDRKRELALSAVLLAGALAVLGHTLLPRTWSTYNRISLNDSYLWMRPNGTSTTCPLEPSDLTDARGREGRWVALHKRLDVADIYYMDITDLSDAFNREYPRFYGDDVRLYSYNLPYTLLHPKSVCVVGSGGGNDVAAALRAGVEEVVAVEIDPIIAEAGRLHHPERPYQDARVTLVVDDARHFFNQTPKKFDLVVFGLLDSHALLSGFGSVRLDNYVYTREAFEAVRRHLKPGGSVACCFAGGPPWLVERFDRLFEEVFGKPPALVDSGRGLTVLSGDLDDYDRLVAAAEAKPLPHLRDPALAKLPLPTDDWPFLYQQWRRLSPTFLWGLLIMGALGTAWVWLLLPEADRAAGGQGQFFWLGVSFLLVEVKSITQLALVWGCTWKVSAIVIGVIMVEILLANLVVAKFRIGRTHWAYVLLLASLVASYFFDTSAAASRGFWEGRVWPTVVLLIPLFFAGIVFAVAFAKASRVDSAFGWNLMGGVLGGFLEYSSLVFGFRFLTLLAVATYGMSWLIQGRAPRLVK
jgi:SAM-dependent methyltransferase